MKLAISGKGGTGKSTLAAALALLLARKGWRVVAVDADPDGNLAAALGASAEEMARIVPISKQKALIEERTGAKVKQYGQMFKLNPEVSDITEGYGLRLRPQFIGTEARVSSVECRGNEAPPLDTRHSTLDTRPLPLAPRPSPLDTRLACEPMSSDLTLLVLGAIEAGGSGCACPENVLVRALVADLVLRRKDAVILDMEAGIEHLGRATVRGVDALLVVVEPSRRALDSAHRVARLAGEIGLRDVRFVANKIASRADEEYVRRALPGREIAGVIPWSEEILLAERQGQPVLARAGPALLQSFESILEGLEPAA
jgi:CO dehydrogenase maturation factor